MKVYYYDFETEVGTIWIAFTKMGLVKLSLPTEGKKGILDFLERNFEEIYPWMEGKEAYGKEIIEYLRGQRKEFTIPLDLRGTDFQKKVWKELIKIPFGSIASYGDIAYAIGNPKASRAIGGANNKNPIPIVIPCHRIIGSDGDLVGYGGGIECKIRLLEIEGIKVKERTNRTTVKHYVEGYRQERMI